MAIGEIGLDQYRAFAIIAPRHVQYIGRRQINFNTRGVCTDSANAVGALFCNALVLRMPLLLLGSL